MVLKILIPKNSKTIGPKKRFKQKSRARKMANIIQLDLKTASNLTCQA